MNVYTFVNVLLPRDAVSFTAERIQFNANLYKMKIDIGILSKYRKCPDILQTSIVAKALRRTNYVRIGPQTTAIQVLLSRPARTFTNIQASSEIVASARGSC